MEEIKIMLKCGRHMNIVNILGVVQQASPLLILEYCEHGSLLTYLRNRHDHIYNHVDKAGNLLPFDEESLRQAWMIFCHKEGREMDFSEYIKDKVLSTNDLIQFSLQIANGMDYLSSRSIIHRDLATRNILVADNYILKISDFGLAKYGAATYTMSNVMVALPLLWMPPEAIISRQFSHKSDVWSFGIVLWEIFSLGKTPFDNFVKITTSAFAEWLIEGHRMDRPDAAPSTIYGIMEGCWSIKPEDRPSFNDLSHQLDTILGNTTNDRGGYLMLNNVDNHTDLLELQEKIFISVNSKDAEVT